MWSLGLGIGVAVFKFSSHPGLKGGDMDLYLDLNHEEVEVLKRALQIRLDELRQTQQEQNEPTSE